MRREARTIVKRADTTWWGYKEIYRYRFVYPFPALVPYDWSMQLVGKIMQQHVCVGSDDWSTIAEMRKIVLNGLPSWAPGVQKHQDTDIASAFGYLEIDQKPSPASRHSFRPRENDEIRWLASFVEVVAWMELKYPNVVHQVKGPDWDKVCLLYTSPSPRD